MGINKLSSHSNGQAAEGTSPCKGLAARSNAQLPAPFNSVREVSSYEIFGEIKRAFH
jgi:hypothetical protein